MREKKYTRNTRYADLQRRIAISPNHPFLVLAVLCSDTTWIGAILQKIKKVALKSCLVQ
uniref:Uncharacterized protein n=1 Tax=Physcomitrium patens TaxID=3218 RepID=A0A2K1K6E3_PHYPA|nr:hypothetical protein PHYPA_011241 [Physcomitrium patens]